MKQRFVYVAALVLMVSGLVFAQSSTAPSTMDTQNGTAMTTAPQSGQSDMQNMQNETPCACDCSKASTNNQHPGSMAAYQGTSQANMNQGESGAKRYVVDTNHVEIEQGRADAGR